MSYKNRIWCGKINEKFVDQEIEIFGWVNRIRDMGNLIFIDLRDRTGIIQLVVDQKNISNFEELKNISNEYVLKVKGIVRKRPKEKINLKISTGEFEVEVNKVEIISESSLLPFPINEEDYKDISVDETLRLKYRFLDLRRPRMFKNLYFRQILIKKMRDFLDENEFIEVETPILSKPTPEGARDFLVPSRLQKGKFYALPQSPQLYKQILMVAGVDRYFQIAKCLRDEDLRADRQPEFTQLDLEMSFINIDDIFQLIEEMLKESLNSVFGIELKDFKIMDYKEAINNYLSDKPDLRFPYPIKELNLEEIQYTGNLKGKAFYMILPILINRKEIDDLYKQGFKFLYLTKQEDNYKGTLAKNVNLEKINHLVEKYLNTTEKYTLILTLNQPKEVLNQVKQVLINKKLILPLENYFFVWINNFPLFKLNEDGSISSEHHPFTNVHPEDKELLLNLYSDLKDNPSFLKDKNFIEKILSLRSLAYDLVLNGIEIGSGSIRIIDSNIQKIIFSIIGLTEEEVNMKFGFLLNSFKYGAPPHGGIALGIDRLVAILLGLNSIREVIAFPKTQSGSCLMTSSPSEVDNKQLEEIGILPLAQERYIKN